jgi:hypothetical protein
MLPKRDHPSPHLKYSKTHPAIGKQLEMRYDHALNSMKETLTMLKQRLSILWLAIFVLTACTSSGPGITQEPQASPTLLATPAASSTAAPTPTETPPAETPTAGPTPTPGPAVYGPSDFPANVNPLTGSVVDDPAILDRRPVAVKIQTYPRGQRPPFGIGLADIVFDYYQNFGLTRLTAIFYGNDAERVSPIRSARLLDAHIVSAYQAIFAFGSADQRILGRLYNSPAGDRLVLSATSRTCPPEPMCRVQPNTVNHLITDTRALTEYAVENGIDNQRPMLDGMHFEEAIPADGKPGAQVYVHYNANTYVRWDFDAKSGRYLRFVDSQTANTVAEENYIPMNDGLTEEQIAADNVVILYVRHDFAFNTTPGTSEVMDIRLTGSERAYAFRDGQMAEVIWNRSEPEGMLYLTYADGTPYASKPGNTWYQVMSIYTDALDQGQGIWRFNFFLY